MEGFKLKSWFGKVSVRIVIAVIVAFVAGYIVRGPEGKESLSENQGYNHIVDLAKQVQQQWWTCSMHPQSSIGAPFEIGSTPSTSSGQASSLQVGFDWVCFA